MSMTFAHGAIQWLTTDSLNADLVVSGLGWKPKAIRFYWVGLQSAADAASEAVNERRGVGFGSDQSGSIVQRAIGSFSQDTAATSNCGAVAINNGVVVTTDGAGAVDGRLSLQSVDSGGFTLNVDDVTPANITVFWEAWGGSDITDVTIGDIAEPAATGTQNYSATGFVAAGFDQAVMFAGCQSTAAVNTAAATDSGMCVGFLTLGGQCVVAGNSDDASTAMDTDGYCSGSRCLAMVVIAGGTTQARAAFDSFGTDQFTLNWEVRATTDRRYIYMAVKGGGWAAGSYTIDGSTGSATATVSSLPFAPIGISLIGRMTADSGTTNTANDRIGLGSGSSTSSRRSMGVLDENATASSACEINTTIQYDQVLSFPSTAGALLSAYDINAMNSDGFQIIVDTAGGVASELQGYLAFGNEPTISGTLSSTNANDTSAASGAVGKDDSETRPYLEWIEPEFVAEGGYGTLGFRIDEPPVDDLETRSYLHVDEYDPHPEWNYYSVDNDISAPAASITGTLAVTNANDTLAASGKVTVKGTLASTNADDTSVATGKISVVGTLSRTEGADTLSATGKVTVTGTLARTEGADTMAASGGTGIVGSLTKTESPDTLAATGKVTTKGTLAQTEGTDTSTASGTVQSADDPTTRVYLEVPEHDLPIEGGFGTLGFRIDFTTPVDDSETRIFLEPAEYEVDDREFDPIGNTVEPTTSVIGTLARTNANDTMAATGGVLIEGTLARTEAGDIMSASGVVGTPAADDPETRSLLDYEFIEDDFFRIRGVLGFEIDSVQGITGTLAKTNANDTLAASGKVRVTGTLSRTNANDTLAASGKVSVKGTLARTNANDTIGASGKVTVKGTLARTEAHDNLSASGKIRITGTVSVTEAHDTMAANGSVGTVITGTLAKTNANDTLAASGKVATRGTVAKSEAPDTLAASGRVDIDGSMSAQGGTDTLASAGKVTSKGTLARTNANDQISATGKVRIVGTLSVTGQHDTITASGTCKTIGVVSKAENPDTLASTGKIRVIGSMSVTEQHDISDSFTYPPSPEAGVGNTWRGRSRRRITWGDLNRTVTGRATKRTTRRY